jgi:regulator of sirC expression with transglutaminase-like and TPR domain
MSVESRIRLGVLLGQDRFDIVEANLLMAQEAEPDLPITEYLERVDALAADATARGGAAAGVVEALRAADLAGARDDYDDPRNSLLNHVLDRGKGLPLSLAALTVAVAERIGVRVVGIGMPGHFIVADLSGREPRYLDPFDDWAGLGNEDCERLVRRTAGVALQPHHLAPVDERAMLLRMLANLRLSYMKRRRLVDGLWCVELALMVSPDDAGLVREHVVLLAGLGRYDDAEGEAAAYLEAYPTSPEREFLERQIAAVNDMRRSMN